MILSFFSSTAYHRKVAKFCNLFGSSSSKKGIITVSTANHHHHRCTLHYTHRRILLTLTSLRSGGGGVVGCHSCSVLFLLSPSSPKSCSALLSSLPLPLTFDDGQLVARASQLGGQPPVFYVYGSCATETDIDRQKDWQTQRREKEKEKQKTRERERQRRSPAPNFISLCSPLFCQLFWLEKERQQLCCLTIS